MYGFKKKEALNEQGIKSEDHVDLFKNPLKVHDSRFDQNERKVKSWIRNREKYPEPKPVVHDPGYMSARNKIDLASTKLQMSLTDQVNECMAEHNLIIRINMLEGIKDTVHRASKPYIEFLIRKYSAMLDVQLSTQINEDDPFGDRK